MFVRNSTSLDVALARGRVSDDVAAATLVVSVALRIEEAGLAPLTAPLSPSEHDPPAEVTRYVLWEGVSVTAAGTAMGPAAPPFVCPVLLRVGAEERRLIVFGDRRWERRFGGGLEAPPPAPFESVVLSFERAFGGAYDLPPGLLPGTDLPHPGMRVTYSLNEHGVGLYPDERAATGMPLPSIERPDQLVRRWNDAPEPAGFTPCPDLVAWKLRGEAAALAQRGGSALDQAQALRDLSTSFRLQHHAPPPLIFDDVPAGTPIELHGLRGGPLRFVVPPSPAAVSVRARGTRTETAILPRLRALHVDAEQRAARFVYDHGFIYHPKRAPSWVRVR
jgi:Uncharacterized protein conserved in bacteria (DUF2169)